MKKSFNRVLSALLIICFCVAMLPSFATEAEAASTGLSLAELQAKFPHGKYWNHAGNPGSSNSVNNQNGYTSTPCSQHGVVGTSKQTCNGFCPGSTQLSWQCMGYAEKLGYDATGYNPRNNANGWYTNTSPSALDSLKAGDIVRYKNNNHSIYVTEVNGDTVTYTDCNSDGHCIIRWGATISKATLRSSFSYVRSAPSSVSPGYCNCSTAYAGTYVCTTSTLDLTIRSGHGTSFSAVGSIPSGATVTVTKATGTGVGDWAHVTYNGISGYASMQYLAKKQADQERNSVMHIWMSDTAMGDSVDSVRTGEWLYLCYKLYDTNTGALFDSYNTSGYTAKLTIYAPNGEVAHSCTYNNDNNWISIRRNEPGEYKGTLTFTFNSGWTGGCDTSARMVYEPRVTPSVSSIDLNLVGVNSHTISISYSGTTASNSIYVDCTTTGNCFKYSWGSWNNHIMPLTITGTAAGQGVVTIKLYDSDTDEVLATSTVYVNVSAPSYTVTFKDWDGTVLKTQTVSYGSSASAPANPTRTGYNFAGWDKSYSNIKANTVVTATYTKKSTPITSDNTYTATLTDNSDGTASLVVTMPSGVVSGKIVIYVSEDLELVTGSLSSVTSATVNENYRSGICVSFASTSEYAEGTVILRATYRTREGATLSTDDFYSTEWSMFDMYEMISSAADGDIIKHYIENKTKIGDVTGDNSINSLDASFILRYDAGLIGVGDICRAGADVTGDGMINALDASFILRYDAGLLFEFPAAK